MARDSGRPAALDGVRVDRGLATLGPAMVALRDALDQRFLAWAAEENARPTVYPPLLEVEALAPLDYFKNFPHLAIAASEIATPETYHEASEVKELPGEHLEPARYVLPSAACFSVYLDLAGTTLEGPRYVTTAANCFRHESSFEGLRRMLGFYMREIVCVAEREVALDYLSRAKERALRLCEAIGMPIELKPASDPFYDPGASRSIAQQLFPVKEELVYGGDLAIGSFNFHRNFFGERCGIRLADGSHAFSGCAAFGLERWLAALAAHFETDGEALLERVAGALQA
jgi:seryl-tRNA synthetase